MTLSWSNLADGWKQGWEFSDQFEHTEADPTRKKLETPRRLSWRECARIQTFDATFTPVGETESKFTQIGNAVPPKLAEAIFTHLFSGAGLVAPDVTHASAGENLNISEYCASDGMRAAIGNEVFHT